MVSGCIRKSNSSTRKLGDKIALQSHLMWLRKRIVWFAAHHYSTINWVWIASLVRKVASMRIRTPLMSDHIFDSSFPPSISTLNMHVST